MLFSEYNFGLNNNYKSFPTKMRQPEQASPLIRHLKEKWNALQLFVDDSARSPKDSSPSFASTKTPIVASESWSAKPKSGFETAKHHHESLAETKTDKYEDQLLRIYGGVLSCIQV